jgi:hypothetical protein
MQRISEYQLLQRKRWRAISYNWDTLSEYGNTSRLYCLTDFQVAWLLSNTDYFGWSSRWSNCPCTEQDMHDMKAEMEYNLMNCVDLQPYQIQYLYDIQQAQELQALADLWDGVNPSSVNENTPDNFYSGDGSADRENALCTAIKIYVYSYAQNWVTKAQLALGVVAIVGIVASITIVGGMIATALVGGLAYLTSFAITAMQDENALDDVVCCIFEALNGASITNANWLTCLDDCNFEVGTNQAIIRDIIASDLDQFNNWLTFINQVGNSYVLVQAGVSDCPCEDVSWVWNSDFATSQNIWQARDVGYGDQATYSSGWQSVDQQASPYPEYRRHICIEAPDFTPTTITKVIATYDMTQGSWQAAFSGFPMVSIDAIKDNDTIIVEGILNADMVNGNGQTIQLDLDEHDIKQIIVRVKASARQTPTYSGSIALPSIEVHGFGFNPFI